MYYYFLVLQMGPRGFSTTVVVLRFQTLLLFSICLKHFKNTSKFKPSVVRNTMTRSLDE